MTPKELIQSMFDELAKGNSRRFVELMADDITWTVMGRTRWSGTYHGKTKVLGDLLGVLRTRLDGPYRATADRILGGMNPQHPQMGMRVSANIYEVGVDEVLR